MNYALMLIVGMLVGTLISVFSMKAEMEDLIEEKYNAEDRALSHFRKLFTIENILKEGNATKEPAVFIVDKINEVIIDRKIEQ